MFINDLAKSSAHCIVKEAALFTLGIIMESNGNKNNIVCISECTMAPVITCARAWSPFSFGLTE